MSSYHFVQPEVAGSWGKDTKFIRTPGQPVVVNKLHYQFDGWLGDNLLESSPCYIVAEQLAAEIERAFLTGVSFDLVETSKSEQFEELHPDCTLPKFTWLKIMGTPGKDDFGLTSDLKLVVSERALVVLKDAGIPHAIIESFNG